MFRTDILTKYFRFFRAALRLRFFATLCLRLFFALVAHEKVRRDHADGKQRQPYAEVDGKGRARRPALVLRIDLGIEKHSDHRPERQPDDAEKGGRAVLCREVQREAVRVFEAFSLRRNLCRVGQRLQAHHRRILSAGAQGKRCVPESAEFCDIIAQERGNPASGRGF